MMTCTAKCKQKFVRLRDDTNLLPAEDELITALFWEVLLAEEGLGAVEGIGSLLLVLLRNTIRNSILRR